MFNGQRVADSQIASGATRSFQVLDGLRLTIRTSTIRAEKLPTTLRLNSTAPSGRQAPDWCLLSLQSLASQ